MDCYPYLLQNVNRRQMEVTDLVPCEELDMSTLQSDQRHGIHYVRFTSSDLARNREFGTSNP